MRLRNNIKIKIVVSMSVCILLFTLVSSLIISMLLGSRLSQRSMQINDQYLNTVKNHLNSYTEQINSIGALCASNQNMFHALSYHSLDTLSARRMSLKAQESLDSYLSSSSISFYTTRLVIFNMDNISITSTASLGHNWQDMNVLRSYADACFSGIPASPVYGWQSAVSENVQALTCLYPLSAAEGYYMYIEIRPALFKTALLPYQNLQRIFMVNEDLSFFLSSFTPSEDFSLKNVSLEDNSTLKLNRHRYLVRSCILPQYGITLCILNEKNLFAGDNLYILYLLLIILLTTMGAVFFVTRVVSTRITKPIQILTSHIRTLSESDRFPLNPKIEASSDEIGEIGKAVNHMALHIQELLVQTERMYEQRKNIEISLLQSQINPHFLYNTLDSIRWMAVIQKSKNIELITKALENLLRNMAKGLGDKIPLSQELSLVEDYIHIQKVRYVEIFDVIYEIPKELYQAKIVKFTLQPIVENAIFHGIEPTGEFGEIKITARADQDSLYITVEDNGAGMTEDELHKIEESLQTGRKDSLSGMGVSNVDSRLKLIYGPGYGLTYESAPGEFTRVTIHLPKEDVSDV